MNHTVTCPPSAVPSGSEALPATDSLSVPGRADQVAVAREFVASALDLDHPLAETAVLLTSELVTNSLQHSASGREGGTITITVARGERGGSGLLRVEVTDDGAHGRLSWRPAARDDESGYGLRLVDALAARWGCATTTWFEITS